MWEPNMSLNMSSTVSVVSNSLPNSRLKDRTSDTNRGRCPMNRWIMIACYNFTGANSKSTSIRISAAEIWDKENHMLQKLNTVLQTTLWHCYVYHSEKYATLARAWPDLNSRGGNFRQFRSFSSLTDHCHILIIGKINVSRSKRRQFFLIIATPIHSFIHSFIRSFIHFKDLYSAPSRNLSEALPVQPRWYKWVLRSL
jgi:hypothetical protein